MSKIYEPYPEERAAAAKALAERVFSGRYEGIEEAMMFLQFIIARHLNIGIFDSYFKDRSLDDLIFESELIRLQTMPAEVQKSEVIKSNAKEAHDLFNDMEAEEDMPDDFKDMAMDFMQSGEFKE